MENISISVIIPAYNVEKYIEKCVVSAFSQSYQAKEVIVVDDGSTDASAAVCRRLKKDYPALHIIVQTNGGVSKARNTGIQNASGEYLYFIDGDDYITGNALESFVSLIETYGHIDYIHGRMKVFYDGENQVSEDEYFIDNSWAPGGADGCTLYHNNFKNQKHLKLGVRGLYRRAFLLENQIFFNEKIRIGEDEEWVFLIFLYAKTAAGNPEAVYCYRAQRPGSLMRNQGNIQTARDLMKIYQGWIDQSGRTHCSAEFRKAVQREAARRLYWCIIRYINELNRNDYREFCKDAEGYKDILKYYTDASCISRLIIFVLRHLHILYVGFLLRPFIALSQNPSVCGRLLRKIYGGDHET